MEQSDIEIIQSKIFVIRGTKVMLDYDLAELYGVDTKALNQAVKRNLERFPEDFMFQMIDAEFQNLRSQIVTAKDLRKTRFMPYAFTQNGIAMLSSVLSSFTFNDHYPFIMILDILLISNYTCAYNFSMTTFFLLRMVSNNSHSAGIFSFLNIFFSYGSSP